MSGKKTAKSAAKKTAKPAVRNGVTPPAASPVPATPVADATQGEASGMDGAGDGPTQTPNSESSLARASKTSLSVSRIEQQLVDAGLDGVDTHTDAQREQAGRILAAEFGIKTIPGRNVELGSALLTLRRVVKNAIALND